MRLKRQDVERMMDERPAGSSLEEALEVFEVFASGGLTYIPMPVIPKADDRNVSVDVKGGPVKFSTLEVHALRSMWDRK